MPGDVNYYLGVLRKYQAAGKRLRDLEEIVTRCAHGLHQWSNFEITGAGPAIDFKVSDDGSRIKVNKMEWPDAETIQQALFNWHAKREAAYAAWKALQAEDRAGDVLPPDPPPTGP